jgi:multisubunit Na+/H+ antiporter MnhB subunit
MTPGLLLDLLLAAALPVVAVVAVVARDLRRAAVVLVSLGLLVALSFIRLDAPDIALAEAAIGAGLTGVLFLDAAGRFGPAGSSRRTGRLRAGAVGALAAAFATAVALAAASLPRDAEGLGPAVARALPGAAAEHPVTAVLLDLRGWDTLLEIAVLLVAVLGVWAAAGRDVRAPGEVPVPILAGAVRVLFPVAVLASGLLLWAGAKAPGGAFQAGVVLGGGGILLALAGMRRPWARRPALVRGALALGLAVFLLAGAAGPVAGRRLLEYPADHAGLLLFTIEAALTVSIAFVVDAVFDRTPLVGAAAAPRVGRREERP